MRGTLRALAEIAGREGKGLYIVGGFVRDALRGRQSRDLDFVVSEDADSFTRRAAFLLRGSYDPLDSAAQHARIRLIADDALPLVLDFSLCRGRDIVADLRRRDFTVNAMAVLLDDYLNEQDWPENIIDPCDGKKDLAAGVLRLTSEESLSDDPVRLLRAARFLCKLELQFDPGTKLLLRRNARLVSQAFVNKLSVEFFKLLSEKHTAESLRVLHRDLQVLEAIYPPFAVMAERVIGEEDLLTHGLQTCWCLEESLHGETLFSTGLSLKLQEHLQRDLEPEHPRLAYLKLACVLHDAGMIESPSAGRDRCPPFFSHEVAGAAQVAAFASRFRLTGMEREFITTLVCNHSRPLYLCPDEGMSPPMQRFFYQFRALVPELVLLAMADQAAGRERELAKATSVKVLEMFFSGAAESLPKPLLSAEEVMEFFNLPPARPVGRLLEAAYAAQTEGKLTGRSEALSLISALLDQDEWQRSNKTGK